jgi:hypothetical protein
MPETAIAPDLAAIRQRNSNRSPGHFQVREGDEVVLSGYNNGEPDEDNPAVVQGVVETIYVSDRFGADLMIGGRDHYLNDYDTKQIVGATAEQDINELLAYIATLAAERDAAQAIVAAAHAIRAKHDLDICRANGCITLGVTDRILSAEPAVS